MADRIQVRRDTAARWKQYNPVLLEGEQGFETDTDQYKMGDGVHKWDELPYRGGPFLQQRGNSTTGAMSQDAVTKEFEKYDASMEELQTEVFPLSATLSASWTLKEYTGAAQSVTVSWRVTRKGQPATPTALVLKEDSVTVDVELQATGNVQRSINKLGVTSYSLEATVGTLKKTATASLQMVLPCYFGFAAASTGVNITSLSKQSVRTTPNGSYTLNNTTSGNYLWLCVPSTMTINKVTSSGFDVPMQTAENGSTTLGQYKCYRSSSPINSGNMSIVIS